MKVLFLTASSVSAYVSANILTGINTYTKHLQEELTCDQETISIPDLLEPTDLDSVLDNFIEQAKQHDIVHIQHETRLFAGKQDDESDNISRFGRVLASLDKHQIPVVVTFHSSPIFYTSKFKFNTDNMLKQLLSRMWRKEIACWFQPKHNTTAIVHTKQTKLRLEQSGFDDHNIHIIPHGVIKPHDNTPQTINADETINLGVFGFISEHKGYETSLRALERLPENYKLILMGGRHPNSTGVYIGKILKMINQMTAIRDRVTVTGYLPEKQIHEWFNKCHICLSLHTQQELSASGTVTWSVSSGIPTIASDIPCFVNIYNQYQCLKLYKTSNVDELVKTIQHLANDTELQQELTKNSNKYYEESNWSNIAGLHVELYNNKTSSNVYSL